MKKYLPTLLTVTVLTALLSSCQMRSPKLESWINPEYTTYKFGKTSVLAMANSESRCLQYETLFVNSLLPYVPAGSLHANYGITGKMDKTQLVSLLKENKIKTLVVTMMRGETQLQQVAPIGYTPTMYTDDYWGYYNWGYTIMASEMNFGLVNSYMEYTLETNVYDVESGKLVWSGRKSVFDDRSDEKNMKVVIKTVIHDLQKRGLLN
ncbi:hypothetical protein P4E94_11910 [Pontiellaceae bacterium B12219]|nr:hypothetical protein [Pontiellaceae bacterium B12219]